MFTRVFESCSAMAKGFAVSGRASGLRVRTLWPLGGDRLTKSVVTGRVETRCPKVLTSRLFVEDLVWPTL